MTRASKAKAGRLPSRVLSRVARGLPIAMVAGASALVLGGGAALVPALAAAGDAGWIAGKVSFSGTPPAARRIKLTADPRCAAMHPDGLEYQAVRVKDGGLADVLVYVKSGLAGSYPAPAEPVVLDQVGCEYNPRMVVMLAGQALRLRNSDDTLHNIHPRPTVNQEFNIGQPRKGMQSTRTFDKPELMIPTGCDVHPWMRVYISVMAHPFFAVTGEDGAYEIQGLPDGEYEIEAVHSQLKSVIGKVSVKAGQAAKLDLSFQG